MSYNSGKSLRQVSGIDRDPDAKPIPLESRISVKIGQTKQNNFKKNKCILFTLLDIFQLLDYETAHRGITDGKSVT